MSTAAKALTVVVSLGFMLVGGFWGALTQFDWRYFLRAEAQGLEKAVQAQRVDGLYRDLDSLKQRERRRKLTDFERAHLQRIQREIQRHEQRREQGKR